MPLCEVTVVSNKRIPPPSVFGQAPRTPRLHPLKPTFWVVRDVGKGGGHPFLGVESKKHESLGFFRF